MLKVLNSARQGSQVERSICHRLGSAPQGAGEHGKGKAKGGWAIYSKI